MDTRFDTYTGKAVTDIINFAKQNTSGGSAIKRVEFDDVKGTTKAVMDPALLDAFDLQAYNETPHYAGNDQNGNPILRYSIKEEFQPGSQSADAYAAKMISAHRLGKKVEDLTDDEISASNSEKKAWTAANPTNLYVTVVGTTINPSDRAKDNYIKYGKAALEMQAGDPEAGVAFNKNLESYAGVKLISNPDTRKRYIGMAAQLNDAIMNKHEGTEFTEPPAVWQQNPNGTQSGFTINYKVTKGEVLMTVDKITLDNKGQYVKEAVVSKALDMSGNLPIQLVKNNLLFGTGEEEDAVSYQVGLGSEEYFVPAQFSLGAVTGQ
jgi:hypothetical protein